MVLVGLIFVIALLSQKGTASPASATGSPPLDKDSSTHSTGPLGIRNDVVDLKGEALNKQTEDSEETQLDTSSEVEATDVPLTEDMTTAEPEEANAGNGEGQEAQLQLNGSGEKTPQTVGTSSSSETASQLKESGESPKTNTTSAPTTPTTVPTKPTTAAAVRSDTYKSDVTATTTATTAKPTTTTAEPTATTTTTTAEPTATTTTTTAKPITKKATTPAKPTTTTTKIPEQPVPEDEPNGKPDGDDGEDPNKDKNTGNGGESDEGGNSEDEGTVAPDIDENGDNTGNTGDDDSNLDIDDDEQDGNGAPQEEDEGKSQKTTKKQPIPRNYDEANKDDSGNFITYFVLFCIVAIGGYVLYHKRQRIMALIVEGRKSQTQRRKQGGKEYNRLSTAEDALPSLQQQRQSSGSLRQVIY